MYVIGQIVNNMKLHNYIPYALQLELTSYADESQIIIDTLESVRYSGDDFFNIKTLTTDYDIKNFYFVKPILKHISEIENIEEIMDEFSDASWEYFRDSLHFNGLDCSDLLTHKQAKLCFKHHIDVYGYLTSNLAITREEVILKSL